MDCFMRYGIFPSKADRIMSRYRPIAPKPVAPAMSSSVPEFDLVSSMEPPGCRQVPDIEKNSSRRARKRKGEALAGSRGVRKTAIAACSMSNSSPSASLIGGGGCGIVRSQANSFTQSSALMEKAAAEYPSLTSVTGVSSSLIESTRMMEQDADFMARAAASAPSSLLHERKLTSRSSGGFTEMIRSITGLSTAEDVHSLMHQSSRSSVDLAMARPFVDLGFVPSANPEFVPYMESGFGAASSGSPLPSPECGFGPPLSVTTMPSSTEIGFGAASSACPVPCVESGLGDASTISVVRSVELGLGAPLLVSAVQSAELSLGASSLISAEPSAELGLGVSVVPSTKLGLGPSSVCFAAGTGFGDSQKIELEDGNDDGGDGKLVTLSLLPDTPSRVESPCESSLSTCSTPPVGGESLKCHAALNVFQNDLTCLQQIYNNSSEPVVLVDDNQIVIWLNKAYEKSLRDAMDRPAMLVPYIDPLGVPTQLGRFDLPSKGSSRGFSVTLWGFLKKLVLDVEGEMGGSSSGRFLKSSHNSSISRNLQLKSPLQLKCEAVGKGSVIVPKPIRLIGSTVSLVSINDIQSQASPLSETLELVKEQLEESALPALISDSSNLVRWVNTAYKQMIGQPECSWLTSTVGDSPDLESLHSPCPSGEVLLSCSVGVPLLAPAFSGKVNILWTNAGERNFMTLPCDVTRLDCSCNGRVMLVWKLGIQPRHRLTPGV